MMLQIGIVEDDADIRTAMVNYLNRQKTMRCDLIADSVE